MARVTVQDCIKIVENRFELILLAAERARNLSKGAEPLLERDRDKNPVVALREIAEKVLNLKDTENELVKGLQKYHEEVLTESEDNLEDEGKDKVVPEKQQIDEDLIKDLESNAGDAGISINENENT
tara:strand:- start:2261 stop:2641 length:381 start_codon:yes stop_codon:yes gene_type:complete